ncbi:MAG TPA: hypothetical protein VHR45_15390 [Thermoanaerobaculia bacterium]|nr:hypothetical protein [Thermoanaerobaculia bacterium]
MGAAARAAARRAPALSRPAPRACWARAVIKIACSASRAWRSAAVGGAGDGWSRTSP